MYCVSVFLLVLVFLFLGLLFVCFVCLLSSEFVLYCCFCLVFYFLNVFVSFVAIFLLFIFLCLILCLFWLCLMFLHYIYYYYFCRYIFSVLFVCCLLFCFGFVWFICHENCSCCLYSFYVWVCCVVFVSSCSVCFGIRFLYVMFYFLVLFVFF